MLLHPPLWSVLKISQQLFNWLYTNIPPFSHAELVIKRCIVTALSSVSSADSTFWQCNKILMHLQYKVVSINFKWVEQMMWCITSSVKSHFLILFHLIRFGQRFFVCAWKLPYASFWLDCTANVNVSEWVSEFQDWSRLLFWHCCCAFKINPCEWF